MFSTLHQGSQVYILLKGNPIKFTIGNVTNVTTPTTYSTYMPNYTIDISVKADDKITEFKQLPGQLSITYYDNGNTVISDDKSAITTEVENMIKGSRLILDSIPYHEEVIASGEEMLKQLNPLFAQLKDLELKITNLETKVGNMESKLDNIACMLTKALNK